MKNQIKFVYFDVGGVLLYWRELLRVIAKKHGKTLTEVEDAYRKFDLLACRGHITATQVWKGLSRELKINPKSDFDYIKETMESFYPIKATHRFAQKISRHFPIGLLTNVHPGMYDLCIQYGHIPTLNYSAVVQSCHLGIIKPEKEIYHHAQREARVPHENILFVDDYDVNVEAARALGWQGVLFDPDKPLESIKKIRKLIGI